MFFREIKGEGEFHKSCFSCDGLDVATGGGHTALALAEHVKQVVVIDITSEMLAEAEKAASLEGIKNITLRAEDVHELNVKSIILSGKIT